jgi:hypothetical protein
VVARVGGLQVGQLRSLAIAYFQGATLEVRCSGRQDDLDRPRAQLAVVAAVHAALLKCKQIELDHPMVDATESKRHVVHPVALVYQGPVGYLVATLWNYDTRCQLPLHRMSAATGLDAPTRQSADIHLQRYLRDQEALNLQSERQIRLAPARRRLAGPPLGRTPPVRRPAHHCRCRRRPLDRPRHRPRQRAAALVGLCSHGGKGGLVRPVRLRRRRAAECHRAAQEGLVSFRDGDMEHPASKAGTGK